MFCIKKHLHLTDMQVDFIQEPRSLNVLGLFLHHQGFEYSDVNPQEKIIMHKALLSALTAALLVGCASTADTRSAECLDARRSIQLIEVESPTSVIIRQDPSRHYRVRLQECPSLTPGSMVSLANAMPRQIYRGHLPPMWGSQIVGSGRVCGGGFDHLIIRKPNDDLSMPPIGCRIIATERIVHP